MPLAADRRRTHVFRTEQGGSVMEMGRLPVAALAGLEADGAVVLGFYDLTCPFCYVAQGKNAVLARAGLTVVELPFQAHPDVPATGLPMGERTGPMYDALAEAAREADLPLRWQPRLPNARLALAAAEWVRCFQPDHAEPFRRSLFAAHFADGAGIDDIDVLIARATANGVDAAPLRAALEDGSALRAVSSSEQLGHRLGVTGTPTWVTGGLALVGNRPVAMFERFAADALRRTASPQLT